MFKRKYGNQISIDEVTKEIMIKDDNKKIKKWLENNKIYFETLMAISLTIMGLIVSIISIFNEKRSIDIQRQQLEIEYSSYLPIFNVTTLYNSTNYIVDGIEYPPCVEYIISNEGGNLTDGYLTVNASIEIRLINKATDEKIRLFINDMERFFDYISYYNSESKSFTVRREFNDRYRSLRTSLHNSLSDYYQEYNVSITMIDYVNIKYRDFNRNPHNTWYFLDEYALIETSPTTIDVEQDSNVEQHFLNISSMTDGEVCNIVIRFLNDIIGNN